MRDFEVKSQSFSYPYEFVRSKLNSSCEFVKLEVGVLETSHTENNFVTVELFSFFHVDVNYKSRTQARENRGAGIALYLCLIKGFNLLLINYQDNFNNYKKKISKIVRTKC
jgi:hypothetical protein